MTRWSDGWMIRWPDGQKSGWPEVRMARRPYGQKCRWHIKQILKKWCSQCYTSYTPNVLPEAMLFWLKWGKRQKGRGMIAFLQLVTWHRWPFRLIDMCFPNTTIWLCSIMQCVSRYQSGSGQPSRDKAHWNTYSLSKNDSWKCFDSHNKIFKQYFWKYDNKLPSILYSGGIFLHNKFFLCRYLWVDCLR